MAKALKLKLPLIQLCQIDKEQNLFRDCFGSYSGKDAEKIRGVEDELGNYTRDSSLMAAILKFLFPEGSDVKGIARSPGGNKQDGQSLPLIGFHLDGQFKAESGGKRQKKDRWASAWANLMYNLGEFNLDEIYLEHIEALIPHIYKFQDNWHVWWASIPEAEDIIRDIWKRISGQELQIVFVDDDKDFSRLFLGDKYGKDGANPALLEIDLERDRPLNEKDLEHSLLWINPGESYCEKEVQSQIDYIVKNTKGELLVFVIDLIFRQGKETNVIKGDALIKYLRDSGKNVLVVGLTGGTSPFIINSAEKAGADIVVFKKRGDDPVNVAGHSSGGNPVGVFDLLWAISWNVSVWRLLEAYKNNYTSGHEKDFRNIALDFFPSIENVSPFWKEYLKGWQTAINNEKIRRLFGS